MERFSRGRMGRRSKGVGGGGGGGGELTGEAAAAVKKR